MYVYMHICILHTHHHHMRHELRIYDTVYKHDPPVALVLTAPNDSRIEANGGRVFSIAHPTTRIDNIGSRAHTPAPGVGTRAPHTNTIDNTPPQWRRHHHRGTDMKPRSHKRLPCKSNRSQHAYTVYSDAGRCNQCNVAESGPSSPGEQRLDCCGVVENVRHQATRHTLTHVCNVRVAMWPVRSTATHTRCRAWRQNGSSLLKVDSKAANRATRTICFSRASWSGGVFFFVVRSFHSTCYVRHIIS